ncbi:hypothetical protein SAY86_008026 [Trapa natans]|uniref:Protein kinase domain-containing protein n=1 Tax=Trapa natans TaxID=22666 RepID=A0AAN7LQ36_TRANT|nr:hypothetical protein SAY86_008026 [Trapa natans]
MMKETHILLLFPLILFSIHLLPAPSLAQPSTTGFTCKANRTVYPCQSYAFYRASSPNFLDLASIADLFEVSRLMISEPSNISSPASPLVSGQPLLVPLTCSCNAVNSTYSISYANISYTIKAGDTFYGVSTQSFGNLTTYQSVMVVNPTLVPTNLSIGVTALFPIFCKCPDSNTTLSVRSRPNYLVSYVFQSSDNVSSVAALFGVSSESIIAVNGNNTKPLDTIFIPVSKLPNLTQPETSPAAAGGGGRRERTGLIVGLSVGLGVLGICLIAVVLLWACLLCYGYGISRREGPEKEGFEGGQVEKWRNEKGEVKASLMADVSDCLDKYRVFKMEELREATEGFSSRCLIQGSVYRGLVDGEVFAIKKMNWNATQELRILQKVNHGNLVKLEGFCIDQEDASCYLVYEFVENGSLHSWLHHETSNGKGERLSWKTRLRIAVDVANGLQYIHEHTRPRVVHKDVKSSNILLDSTMRAKIANFGLAKSGCNAITMHIVGTPGYIAPEYLTDGMVSTRMDVFSFGVVLLELVSGKEAADDDGKVMLWAAAAERFEGLTGDEEMKAKRVREWMDPALAAGGDTVSMEGIVNVVNIALACLNKDPAKRPSMMDIVYALSKSDDVLFDVSEDGIPTQPLLAR